MEQRRIKHGIYYATFSLLFSCACIYVLVCAHTHTHKCVCNSIKHTRSYMHAYVCVCIRFLIHTSVTSPSPALAQRPWHVRHPAASVRRRVCERLRPPQPAVWTWRFWTTLNPNCKPNRFPFRRTTRAVAAPGASVLLCWKDKYAKADMEQEKCMTRTNRNN